MPNAAWSRESAMTEVVLHQIQTCLSMLPNLLAIGILFCLLWGRLLLLMTRYSIENRHCGHDVLAGGIPGRLQSIMGKTRAASSPEQIGTDRCPEGAGIASQNT